MSAECDKCGTDLHFREDGEIFCWPCDLGERLSQAERERNEARAEIERLREALIRVRTLGSVLGPDELAELDTLLAGKESE